MRSLASKQESWHDESPLCIVSSGSNGARRASVMGNFIGYLACKHYGYIVSCERVVGGWFCIYADKHS